MIIKKFKDNRTKKYIRIFLDSSFWGFSGIRSIMLEQLFYWKVNDYFVVGKLDRVDINKDSKIRVVDYKVSGYLKGKNNSGQSQPEDSHCLQLKVYIGALSDIYKKPLEDINGFLFYLKDDIEVSLCPDYGQIEKSKQIILDAIDNITKGNFGSKFKKTCEKKCGYVKFCSRY
jgi:CRISPR/Cas system-associated exonuclease Cas4 (RecB family)